MCHVPKKSLKNFAALPVRFGLRLAWPDFDWNQTIWHYTNGPGFLGIIRIRVH